MPALLIQSNVLLRSKNTNGICASDSIKRFASEQKHEWHLRKGLYGIYRYCGGAGECFGDSGSPFSIGGIRFSLTKSHFFRRCAAKRRPAATLHPAPIWGLRPHPLDFGPFRAHPLDFLGPPPPPGGCQHVMDKPSKGLDTLWDTHSEKRLAIPRQETLS